ncbi:MAG: sigma-54 dependent transcriptional regulator [Planctomycetota bacterium]
MVYIKIPGWARAGKWCDVLKILESTETAGEKIKILEEFYSAENKEKKPNRHYIGASAHYLADPYRGIKNEPKAEEYYKVAKGYYTELLTNCVAIINKKNKSAADIEEVQNDLVTLLPDLLRLFREHDKSWGIRKLLHLWENIRSEIHIPLPIIAAVDHLKRKESKTKDTIDEVLRDVVGTDPKFTKELFRACIVGNYNVPVLILGETGTGKEIIAKTIRLFSKRADKPFMAVNCATLSETLMESELFGHKKGSFSGAIDDKKGKFEVVNGGTLFLDEIAELPSKVQAGILRAIQEGEITPVGSNEIIKVDVRLICATNEILSDRIRDNKFRKDLFYRIAVYIINLPSLRERTNDIPSIAGFYANKFAQDLLTTGNVKIEPGTIEKLQKHPWPGNIRELQNVIIRAIINYDGESIKPEDIIFDDIMQVQSSTVAISPLKEMEKAYITMALRQCNGNKTHTAKKLLISRNKLLSKLKQFKIIV